MPHVKYCDFDSHGYGSVDVTPERLRFEWWTVDTIRERSPGQRHLAAFEVRNGDPHLFPAAP